MILQVVIASPAGFKAVHVYCPSSSGCVRVMTNVQRPVLSSTLIWCLKTGNKYKRIIHKIVGFDKAVHKVIKILQVQPL